MWCIHSLSQIAVLTHRDIKAPLTKESKPLLSCPLAKGRRRQSYGCGCSFSLWSRCYMCHGGYASMDATRSTGGVQMRSRHGTSTLLFPLPPNLTPHPHAPYPFPYRVFVVFCFRVHYARSWKNNRGSNLGCMNRPVIIICIILLVLAMSATIYPPPWNNQDHIQGKQHAFTVANCKIDRGRSVGSSHH